VTLCDNGCNTHLGSREHPVYSLIIHEKDAYSKTLYFCSTGCLIDTVQLTSQGLRSVPFFPLEDNPVMSDKFEKRIRERLKSD
jgi:hypothetical protein